MKAIEYSFHLTGCSIGSMLAPGIVPPPSNRYAETGVKPNCISWQATRETSALIVVVSRLPPHGRLPPPAAHRPAVECLHQHAKVSHPRSIPFPPEPEQDRPRAPRRAPTCVEGRIAEIANFLSPSSHLSPLPDPQTAPCKPAPRGESPGESEVQQLPAVKQLKTNPLTLTGELGELNLS
jgi:hypothetical protein